MNSILRRVKVSVANVTAIVIALFGLAASQQSLGQTPVFTDDYNRVALSPGGTPSTVYSTGNSGGGGTPNITTNFVQIASSGSNGRNWATGTLSSYSSPFNTTLNLNAGVVTWTFNVRTNRTTILNSFASGNGNYGQAVVLVGTSASLNTGGNGYAVVYAGTTNNYRLVAYNNGIQGTLTNIVNSGANDFSTSSNYVSIRVTYTPSTDTWELFSRDDGASAWADPSSGVTTSRGTGVNSTYTGTAMIAFGYFWNSGNTSGQNAQFDNFTVSLPSRTNYYSKSTGFLNVPATWGTNTDGTGTSPSNFSSNLVAFNIRNNPTPTLGTVGDDPAAIVPWAVNGAGSKVIVGDGVADVPNFTVPPTVAFTGLVDVSAGATLTLQNTVLPTFGALNATSTINYASSGTQAITTGVNYGNLTSSNGTAVRTLPSGTIGVASVFTPGTNNYAVIDAANVISFNGTGGQTIPAFTYNSLTSAGSGTKTLSSTGTIGIAAVFTPTNPPVSTGSTIEFTGTGSQAIPAFNFFNLSSSGGGARTIAAATNVGIAGALTTGGSAFTWNATSTATYNGTGAQTIPALNYGNLTVSNGTGPITLASSGTIGIATAFTPGAAPYTITGSTINFNGTGAQTVPAFNYNNLTISGAHGTNSITLVNGGTIGVAGNFSATATFTGAGNYVVTNNTISFNGSSPQTMSGLSSATTTGYNNVTIANTSGDVTLSGNARINGLTTFTSGLLKLSTFNLNLSGQFTGAGAAKYIQTNSTGLLKRFVTAADTTFPVGAGAYNPIILNNTGGTADTFGIRVIDGAVANATTPSKTVDRTWMVTENVAGGNNLRATLQYNSPGEEEAGFAGGSIKFIGLYNPSTSTWLQKVATGVIAPGPVTFSSSPNTFGITIPANGYFALGTDDGLSASPTQFAVTRIFPASPSATEGFNVTVKAVDGSNIPRSVLSATSFDLSTNGAAGTIGGIASPAGTIPLGLDSVVVTGVTLSTPGTGATITATLNTGDPLTPGTSALFNVLAPADHLAFISVPASGTININLGNIIVEAQRPDNSKDSGFNGAGADITLGIASGPVGTFSAGTNPKNATFGRDTFSNMQINTVGNYTLNATHAAFTPVPVSSTIVILPTPSASDMFRSAQSGLWATAATWESSPDGGANWQSTNGLTPTSAAGTVQIRNGHIVTVGTSLSIDQVTVDAGGQVTVGAGSAVTLTILDAADAVDFNVSGTLKDSTNGTITPTGALAFQSGANYFHQVNGGTVPTSTWNDGSTCTITGATTTVPGNLGQSFYNYTWNCVGQTGAINNAVPSTTIRGSLRIQNVTAGTSGSVYITFPATVTILNDFIINSGLFGVLGSTTNIGVAGNFTMTGGNLTNTLGTVNINFNGTTVQTYSKTAGTFSGAINFAILSNAIVDFGTSIIDGSSGTFNLNAGGTLRTANTAGIAATGATGTIQSTGTRTFNAGGNITYNGSAAQVTGTGLVTANNLAISNAAGVTLTNNNVKVNGILNFTAGLLTLGVDTLIVTGPSGSITGASATSYIQTNSTGMLKRYVDNNPITFRVGNSSYNPITLTNSGTADTIGIRVLDNAFTTSNLDTTRIVIRRWRIKENVAGGSNLAVVAQYNGTDPKGSNFASGTNDFIGLFNGTAWTQVAATDPATDPNTFTSSSNFTPSDLTTNTNSFALGRDGAFTSGASHFAITNINPNPVTSGSGFSVTVKSRNVAEVNSAVSANTSFSLSVNIYTGGAAISGTVTGTILAGTDSIVVAGVILTPPGTGAQLTATQTGGDPLTPGVSALFNVLQPADHLFISFTPATGNAFAPFTPAITVQANRPDFTVDNTFTGNITLSINTGPGGAGIFGTVTRAAVAGVATFNDIYVDQAGVYTLRASSAPLTDSVSANITVTDVSIATDYYRSAVPTGNWGDASSWETSHDNINNWIAASVAPDSTAKTITVRNTHNITVAASVRVDEVVVENGGTVTISTGQTLTVRDGTGTDLNVSGTITNAGTIALSTAGTPTIAFQSTGIYNHNQNGGTVPTATWNTTSNCNITGMTAAYPGGMGQSFGNVTFASVVGSNILMSSNLSCHDLTISNTGGSALRLTDGGTTPAKTITVSGGFNMTSGNLTIVSGDNPGDGTVAVTGNFSISGGTFILKEDNGIAVLNVGGDFSMTGGTFNLRTDNTAAATVTVTGNFSLSTGTFSMSSNGTGTLNVAGNFSHTGGTLSTSAAGNIGNIIFNKTGTQTFTSGGTVTNTINYTVNSGSILQMASPSTIVGPGGGSFTLSNGGGLGITSVDGIALSGATGNIQVTGTRTFNADGDYIYNNSTPAAQATGLGLTNAHILRISNSAGVTLSTSVNTDTLDFVSGNITLGANNLSVIRGATRRIIGADATKHVITNGTGVLRRRVATNATEFAIGTVASYNPITLTNTGTADTLGVRVADATIDEALDASYTLNRKWIVSENTPGGSNLLGVVAQYNGSDPRGANFDAGTSPNIGFWDGSAWVQRPAAVAGADPFTFTATTAFNLTNLNSPAGQYFALGKDQAFLPTATTLQITAINPNPATVGSGFSVTVQAVDDFFQPAVVSANTNVILSLNPLNNPGYGGSLGGTVTGTITAGNGSAVINGVTLDQAGTGIILTVSRTSGDALAEGNSEPFDVLAPADHLAFTFTPANGNIGAILTPAITVQAQRPVTNAVDNTYSGNITLQIATGPVGGNFTGGSTTTVAAVNGVATFSNIQLTVPGDYTLRAITTAPPILTQAISNNIHIFDVSVASDYFRSVTTGNWNSTATWESSHDNSDWFPATLTPDAAANEVHIQNTHIVTVTAAIAAGVDQLVIESGGEVDVNTALTIQNGAGTDLDVTGTFKSSAAVTTTGTSIVFHNGGKYQHNLNGGTIPTATWQTGSTCEILGVTGTTPGGLGQTFYNFTWNCPSGTTTLGTNMTINGDFTIPSTNASTLQLVNNTNTFAITVGKNFSLAGGTFNLAVNALLTAPNGTLNVAGNFSLTGGTLTMTVGALGAPVAAVVLNGTSGTQTFTRTGGTISNAVNFTISSTSKVDFGLSTIPNSATGTFTFSSGATIITAHPDGLTLTGATGTIQSTGARSYSSGGNYVFNGDAQNMGNFIPAAGVLNSLEKAGTGTLTNTIGTSFTVSSALRLTSGLFAVGAANTVDIGDGGQVISTGGNLAAATAAGTIAFDGAGTVSATGALTFNNVNILSGAVNFGATGTPTVNGILSINSNSASVITNAPFYGSSSTLRYFGAGSYPRGTEWSATSGRGYPNNVTIQGSTLNVGTSDVPVACAGNLTLGISGSGGSLTLNAPTPMTNALTVGGNISIGQDVLSTLTLSTLNGGSLTLQGNWSRTNFGSFVPNGRRVTLTGTGAQASQTISSPAGGETFAQLFLNKASGTVTPSSGNLTITNQLTFSAGNNSIITPGAFTVIIANTAPGSVSRLGIGHVNGKLQRAFAAGAGVAETFDIGDNAVNKYTPVAITFANISTGGNITAQTTPTNHPNISTPPASTFNPARTITRYWNLTNSGVSPVGFDNYSAVFTWIEPGDDPAPINTSVAYVGKYDAPNWTYPTMGVKTATTAQITGVTSMSDFQVGECVQPTLAAPTIVHVSCFGAADGSITVPTPTDGSIPPGGYTYSWTGPNSFVSTNQNITGLAGGTYHLIVHAQGGCISEADYIVNEPVAVTLSVVATDVTCAGAGNGTIEVTSNTTYVIKNSSDVDVTANTVFGPDTYTITATAPGGNIGDECTKDTTVTITEPPLVTLSVVATNVTCNGEGDGTINVTSNSDYVIKNSSDVDVTANTVFGPDTYTITAGPGLCEKDTTVTITEPTAITLSVVATNVTCNGEGDGTINVTSNSGYVIKNSSDVDVTANTVFGPDTYTITATAPGGNIGDECTKDTTVTITEPTAVTLSVVATNVTCNGEGDGTINVTSNSGYVIKNSSDVDVTANTVFGPDTYTITATAPGGNIGDECTKDTTVTITEPTAITLSVVATNVSCNGEGDGTINVTSNSDYVIKNSSDVDVTANTVFGPDTYTITATAPGGNVGDECTKDTTVTITEPTAVTLSVVATNVSCNGAGDGTINVTSNSDYVIKNSSDVDVTANTVFGPDTYTITATAPGGNIGDECTRDTTVTITEPIAVTLSVVATNVTCNGEGDGTISVTTNSIYVIKNSSDVDVTANTSFGPDTYTITAGGVGCEKDTTVTITQPTAITLSVVATNVTCNGEGDGTINVTSNSGYVIKNSSDVDVTANTVFGPDTYTITATAPGGNIGDECTKDTTVTITEPTAVTLSVVATNVTCNGEGDGTINVTSNSGYVIKNSSDVDVTANTSFGPETYTITATAPGGNVGDECTKDTTVTITEPTAITLSVVATNVSCNGEGDATINVTSNSDYVIKNSSDVDVTANTVFGPDTYTITATAPGGNVGDECTKDTTVTITEPTAVTLSVVATNVSCNGAGDGTINVTSNSDYVIKNSSDVDVTANTVFGPDTYTITATAPGGNIGDECTRDTTVTITEPIAVTLSVVATNVTCNGEGDGTISVTTNSIYVIKNSSDVDVTANTSFGPDTYTITAGGVGCEKDTTVTITQPDALSATISGSGSTCSPDPIDIQVTITGGTGPDYTVIYTDGSLNYTATNLDAGLNNISVSPTVSPTTYTLVSVTDDNGCGGTISGSAVITINDPVTATPDPIDATVNAGETASFTSGATGTVTSYNWQYSTDGNEPWTDLTDIAPYSGTATTELTITNTPGSLDGYHYRFHIIGACNTVNSDDAVLHVNSAPVLTCPDDISVNNDAGECNASVEFEATTTNPSTITYEIPGDPDPVTITSPHVFPVGTTVVTVSATDDNGTSTCSFSVTVTDNEDPVITGLPADITLNTDAGHCKSSKTNLPVAGATDNCEVSGGVTNNAPDSLVVGTTVVTWTATDIHGNTGTAVRTVTIEDNEDPVITCPANQTVTVYNVCDTTLAPGFIGTATATDNCGIFTIIGTRGDSQPLSAPFPPGNTTIAWIAVDVHGNSASCVQTIRVVTVRSLTIECPADVTVSANGPDCTATDVAVGTPTTGISCGVASVSGQRRDGHTVAENYPYPFGQTIIDWTAVDVYFRVSTCTQTVTVVDNSDPTITAPADVTVNADEGLCSASEVDLGTPETNDNCGVEGDVTNDAPATFPVGTTVVTWTVTDIHGNSATDVQNVVVVDNQNPTLTFPASITVETEAGVCNRAKANVDFDTSAADNCGVQSVTNDAPATFPVGTTTVHWTVTDIHSNVAYFNQDITVEDNELPVINCPANITVNANLGLCSADTATVHVIKPVPTDNCGIFGTGGTRSDGHLVTENFPYPVGQTTITWSTFDIHGNFNSCIQTVVVVDNQQPTITAPGNVTVAANNAGCSATGVSLGSPTTGDNCAVQGTTNDAPSTFPTGTTIVTWTVTDVHGNTNTATQNVVVTTTLSASASAGSLACGGGTTTLTVNASGGGGSYQYSLDGGSYQGTNTFTVGAGTHTATVQDLYGCTAVSNEVTVTEGGGINADATAGSIVCNGGTTTLTVVPDGGSAPYHYSLNGGDDQDENTFTVGAGTYTVTVTDGNGCTGTSNTVIVGEPLAIGFAETDHKDVTCNGLNNGRIKVAASGGALPYQYTSGGGPNHPFGSFGQLYAGTYSFTVTDANGCSAYLTDIVVTEPGTLNVDADVVVKNACFGTPNGSITVNGTGGTAPYRFSLTGAQGSYQTSTKFSGLAPGSYTIYVKDANKCVASLTNIIVGENPLLSGSTVVKTACFGASDGSITVSGSGGTSPYKYSLTGNAGSYQGTNKFSGLAPNTYTVYIKDAAGCIITLTNVIVGQNPQLTGSITAQTNSACAGSTGSVTVAGSGGTPGYKYSLTNIAGDYKANGKFTGLAAGGYTVYVKDANGCVITVPVTIGDNCSFAGTDGKLGGGAYFLDAKVLPNPTETEFNLILRGNSKEVVEVRVLDMYGKTVHRARGSANDNYRFGDRFAVGVYIVQILQGDHVKTIKVVKG